MSSEASNTQHFFWLDVIRVISIFLVVVIHVAAGLLMNWGKIPSAYWMSANIYDSFARICVPLLFMVSGYLMLGKDQSVKDFLLRRVTKLAIPFAVWSLFYLFWRCQINHGVCTSKVLTRLIFEEGTAFHLWFLYALMGLYLATPLLRAILRSGGTTLFWYLIGLWVIFQPVITLIHELFNIDIGIQVPAATGFVGYYILGYLLGNISLARRLVLPVGLVWLLSNLATIAGTYLWSIRDNQFNGFFYEYLSINIILASATAFLLLRWLFDSELLSSTPTATFISRLASASFGIYLIHILILDIIGGHLPLIHFHAEMGNPLWSIPLVSVIGFIVSFCAVFILQKIPFVRQTVT